MTDLAMPTRQPGFIEASQDNRVWHLGTPNSSYVVGVDAEGLVTQRYWGPRLDESALREFAEVDRLKWNSSFQRPAEIEEQMPVDGGQRWSVPSLQVVFPDGIRSLDLSFASASLRSGDGSPHLVIVLRDSAFDFGLELHYRLHSDTDVIERWAVLSNSGDDTIKVLRADSGNWLMPELPDYRASTVHGYWAAETQLERRTLQTGEYTLTSRHGTTGQQSNPWIMIDDGSATETQGEVWSVALAWSGSWRLTAQRRPEGGVSVSLGFGHDGLTWSLKPGDELQTPPSLGMFSPAGFGAASRSWHTYARQHVLPKPEELRPVLFNSWEATGFDVTVAGQASLAAKAAGLGVELFVVDDGWFGQRTHDAAGLGDWHPNPDRFPHGLRELTDIVRHYGMKFGIWVEPEMVNPDSDLYRAHPDWVLHWPQRPREERRNQLVLNFGRPDVRAWAAGWLTRLVQDEGIDFIKWDMNRPFTQAGWPSNTTNQDSLWIEHTRGVYAVIDELRSAHPALRIESCSSGGGRADLGILSRTDQVWTSDNTDSLDRQAIQYGFSQLYPSVTMGAWVTETVNDMTGRHVPLTYRFHVAMAGNLGIGGNLDEWSEKDLTTAQELIAQYKTIRRTVQQGELYRLGGTPGITYSAIQYVSHDQVVLLAYEPHRSLATTPRRLRLHGLDPEAHYRDLRTGLLHTGAILMGRGILFNEEATQRGWNNTRFSAADYASSLTIFDKLL
jgi:alpha-galactosidase